MRHIIRFLFAALALLAAVSSCGKPVDEPPVPPDVKDPDPLVLSAGKPTFLADGVDEVRFTVMQGEEDVTDKADIFLIDGFGVNPLPAVYTSTAPGEYTFYAYLTEDADKPDRLESNRITVTAIEDNGFDAEKMLHKNVAFFTFTATWCAPCYVFKGELHRLEEKYGDNLVMTNFYTTDSKMDIGTELFQPFSDQMAAEGFEMGYAPTCFADLSIYLRGDATSAAIEEAYLAGANIPAPVGIKVNSAKNGPYIEANITLGAQAEGTYHTSVFLVEDNLVAPQMMDTGLYDDTYIHTNVLRASSVKNNIFGEETGTLGVDEVVSKDYRFTIASSYNSKNLALVVYVLHKKDDKWVIANCIKAPAEGITDFQYDE